MISAISNQGLMRFEFIEAAMNAERLTGFMSKLIEDSAQKVFLILDNLKAHHAKRVTAWLAEHQDDIEVFYLPPYSPEISPDEYLKTRLRSADRAESKMTLLQQAAAFMDFLVQTPKRVMAYFKRAAVQYIAATAIRLSD